LFLFLFVGAGTPHYTPKSWDIEIRGPTPLDPPDVWQPSGAHSCCACAVLCCAVLCCAVLAGDVLFYCLPTLSPSAPAATEFTNCTVPLVWWLTYFSIFGDLFIGSSLGLDMMMHDDAFDR
jgi:hypothetical protein